MNTSQRIRAKHYATQATLDLRTEAGRIAALGPADEAVPPDVRAGWMAPALFDLQINGCDGRAFSSRDLGVEDVRHVVRVCRRHGVGGPRT